MAKSTQVMEAMQRLCKVADIQVAMRDMAKEMMKVSFTPPPLSASLHTFLLSSSLSSSVSFITSLRSTPTDYRIASSSSESFNYPSREASVRKGFIVEAASRLSAPSFVSLYAPKATKFWLCKPSRWLSDTAVEWCAPRSPSLAPLRRICSLGLRLKYNPFCYVFISSWSIPPVRLIPSLWDSS